MSLSNGVVGLFARPSYPAFLVERYEYTLYK